LAAVAVALVLAGCEIDELDLSARALEPLSQAMFANLQRKHMPKESPILIRLFKEEAELEVWKQDDGGRFALLATYPICRWSGELGRKLQQGRPPGAEGFYSVARTELADGFSIAGERIGLTTRQFDAAEESPTEENQARRRQCELGPL
jgi:murein L,D-transpeptidase YafK